MTAALEVGEWSAARPGRTSTPGKTRYPLYKRLGGPQGRSGRAENLVPTGIRSRTVQPVVSRYTDWATGPTYRLKSSHQLPVLYIHVYIELLIFVGVCRWKVLRSLLISTRNPWVLSEQTCVYRCFIRLHMTRDIHTDGFAIRWSTRNYYVF